MSCIKIKELWLNMHTQQWEKLADFFEPKAVIEWPNTNEMFNVDGFVKANADYPGKWNTVPQRIEACERGFFSVTKISQEEDGVSFYAISFFEFKDDKITHLTEYWSENGTAPEWRKALGLN